MKNDDRLIFPKGSIVHIFSPVGTTENVPGSHPKQGHANEPDEVAIDLDPRKVAAQIKLAEPLKPVAASANQFANNMDGLIETLNEIFKRAIQKSEGGLQLESVDVALSVSADGTVGILGIGGTISGTASFTLHFSRP